MAPAPTLTQLPVATETPTPTISQVPRATETPMATPTTQGAFFPNATGRASALSIPNACVSGFLA
jgi:hypothetical protein